MEITKEMIKRQDMAQQASQGVMQALDELTLVEALGVLDLVKHGILRYADVDEVQESLH